VVAGGGGDGDGVSEVVGVQVVPSVAYAQSLQLVLMYRSEYLPSTQASQDDFPLVPE
jgi:hypothetical protein